MKLLAKAALGALVLAGATAMTAVPADAHVSIGIGFGYPGYYYGPSAYPYNAYCDPRSRWYDPYRCDEYDGYGYDYYDGPVFIDGFWFDGPFRSRFFHGHREFFAHGGWHGGTGWHEGEFHHDAGLSGRSGFSGGNGFNGRSGFSGRDGTSSHGDFHGGRGHGDFHGGFSGGDHHH